MSFKKLIGNIHLWLGLLSGLVVFILGLTGCILAFEEEIIPFVYADKLYVPPTESSPCPLSESLLAAQKALGDSIPVERIRISNQQGHSYIFTNYTAKKNITGIWYGDDVKYFFWVYANPYTAQIIKVEDHTFEFFRTVAVLHWRLLLINDIGQPIVGTATIIFFITLITGLVLWWPKNKAAREQRFWFRWKNTTSWKRKNYDLHNIVGFYCMFLVLFIVFTGLVWAFDWFEDSVQWIANGGEIIQKKNIEAISTPAAYSAVGHTIDMVYQSLKNQYPEAEGYSLNLPKDSLETIRTTVNYSNLNQVISLQFDQYSGEQLILTDWNNKTNGEKVRAYNFDIHTGAIAGIVGETIAFFVSLFSASLPVTGFTIWYARNKKKLKHVADTNGVKKMEGNV